MVNFTFWSCSSHLYFFGLGCLSCLSCLSHDRLKSLQVSSSSNLFYTDEYWKDSVAEIYCRRRVGKEGLLFSAGLCCHSVLPGVCIAGPGLWNCLCATCSLWSLKEGGASHKLIGRQKQTEMSMFQMQINCVCKIILIFFLYCITFNKRQIKILK